MNITHLPAEHRFEYQRDQLVAVLEYRLDDDQTVDFYHTFVPPEMRGGKVAVKLVNQGLEWAQQQGLTIKASCWFVQKFL